MRQFGRSDYVHSSGQLIRTDPHSLAPLKKLLQFSQPGVGAENSIKYFVSASSSAFTLDGQRSSVFAATPGGARFLRVKVGASSKSGIPEVVAPRRGEHRCRGSVSPGFFHRSWLPRSRRGAKKTAPLWLPAAAALAAASPRGQVTFRHLPAKRLPPRFGGSGSALPARRHSSPQMTMAAAVVIFDVGVLRESGLLALAFCCCQNKLLPLSLFTIVLRRPPRRARSPPWRRRASRLKFADI